MVRSICFAGASKKEIHVPRDRGIDFGVLWLFGLRNTVLWILCNQLKNIENILI